MIIVIAAIAVAAEPHTTPATRMDVVIAAIPTTT
jgi:hypothetical protein